MAEAALGIVVVVGVLFDVFQAIVTPRPVAGRVRVSRYLIRSLWYVTRWVSYRVRSVGRREALLGSFGPFSVLAMLFTWVVLFLCAYGLLLDSMRNQIKPEPSGFGES